MGGAQENTITSVLGLRGCPEFEVHLVSGPTTGPEGSLEPRVATVPGLLTVLPSLVRPIHPWQDLQAWRSLTRHFRRERPHLVHTHSGKAGFVGRLAAHRARVPVVVHTIHGPSFGAFQGGAANRLFRTAERLAGRHTTHFVTVAHAMRDQYLQAGIGGPEQYTRVFSGFDLQPYLRARPDPELRQQLGLAEGQFVVGKIARLFERKGHEDLLEAANRWAPQPPGLRLLLVGDGSWRARLEARAAALGLRDRVVFAGLVPPETIPQYVALMDVLVHLSRREGLPRALPQALAAGRPVIAYDCDGAREVCLDGQTGFLLPPGDQRGLIQRLEQLRADPALRQQLGEAGRRLVGEHFSAEKMVADLRALYLRLLAAACPDAAP